MHSINIHSHEKSQQQKGWQASYKNSSAKSMVERQIPFMFPAYSANVYVVDFGNTIILFHEEV